MKNLFTYLKALWGAWGNLQSKDISLDRRSTVVRPSGLEDKLQLNTFVRFAVVLTLIFSIGVGDAWGQVSSAAPADGGEYVVTVYSDSKYYALPNTTTNGGTLAGVEVTVNSSGKVTSDNPPTWTLTKGSTSGQFYLSYTNGVNTYYLYKNGTGKSNYNFKVSTGDKNYWSFTTSSTGYTVTAVDRGSNNLNIQLNGTTFRCNATASVVRLLEVAAAGPSLTATPTSLDFGTVAQNASIAAKTFSVSGSNLTGAITIAAPSGYTVSPTSITPVSKSISATDVTVTPNTATAGTFNGNVTISGGGLASNVTVGLTMTVQASHTVTWMVNGSEHATTQVVSGGHPAFPSVPSSCDAGKVFVGWTETNIGSSETDTPPTFITTATTISSDKTYYAVFAKKGDFIRVTGPSSLANGQLLVIVSNKYSTAITNGIGYTTAPTESNSKVTATDAMTWLLTGNSTSGWAISKIANGYLLGYASNPSSNSSTAATLASNNSCSTWGIGQNSSTSNVLYISNKSTATCALEASSSSANWVVYNSSSYSSNQYCALKVYASTLTKFVTSCCTPLGTINGSVSLSQGGNSVTIKDWSAVANAGTYTVKMYKKNGASWDLVSGTAASASAGTQGTRTGITEAQRTSGVTFTGLVVESEYKFTVQAIAGSSAYCDGVETDVTSINSTDVSSTPFKFRYSIYIDNGSGSGWAHHYITPTANANEGSVSIDLTAHVTSYQFKIAGGLSGWWGQTRTDNIPANTKWTLDGGNNVNLNTGAGGAYVFTVDYSGTTNPGVRVTFPSADQAAGHKIYFDKSIIAGWGSTLKYRIGNGSHNQNQDFTLVPGTDQFYVTTTPAYGSMDAWQIANNVAWSGSNSIYNYYHVQTTDITRATIFFDYIVEEDITMVPSSKKNTENSCDFWYVDKTSGMLTHTATITPPTNGTINIAYTDVNSAAQNKTATTAGLAHRTKITATATPATGYKAITFTVTPSGEAASNLTSGATDNHILAKDATFAATFTAKQAAITFDKNSGTSGSDGTTATYGTAMTTITAPTRLGYTFGGYYDAETSDNGSGNQYYNVNGTSARTWDKDTEAATTLYAKWTPVNYTITYHLNDGTNPGGVPTGFTIESAAITLPTPTREGYNFMGWYADEDLSTGGVQTTIAAGLTGDKEYWAKWEIKKYTVTWHVGESTSTTSNVAHFTTFSTLEASAPAHADNALAACGSTKFIGWVKASGEYTEDGKTADWYNTHKYAAADEITGDVDIYAMYAEASGGGTSSEELIASELTTNITNTTCAYGSEKTYTDNSKIAYAFSCWTDAASRPWVQMKKEDSNAYIKITAPGNITQVDMTITSASNASGGVTDISKHDKLPVGTIINLNTEKTNGTSHRVAYVAGDGSSTSRSIVVSSPANTTLYLQPTGGACRIWGITVHYSSVSYSNYRTGCTVSCGAPVLSAVTGISANGATISWTDDGKAGTLDHYEYAVWADGEDEPTSGFVNNGTTKNKALTGLLSNTDYNYKVRRVCTGDDNSRWSSGSFTTGNVSLTFSVPTGASAVAGQNSNVALPTAEVPTDCGDCWAFAGWTTAEYAESSSAPAKLFAAGDIVHLAAADGSTMYAVYVQNTFKQISSTSELVANDNYVLTFINTNEYALSNEKTYTHDAAVTNVTSLKRVVNGENFLYTVGANNIYKFTGTYSSGQLYNVAADKYVNLSSTDADLLRTTDDLAFAVNAENKKWTISSTNYLKPYGTTSFEINASSTDAYAYIYRQNSISYTTSPDCPKYTVTWDINNGATTSTTDVTKCEGYLSALPSAPADNTLSGCQTNGKFMGWSASKVMPAQDVAPADIFSEVEDAPKITENVTFYAVFANGVAGAATPVNTTYTFNSKSWGDATNSWSSNTAGDELTSGRGIKILGSASAEGITKNSYTDVTKVVVTYCTNASSGTGSVTVTVGDTEFGTNSISKPSSGGATLKTFTYTHAAATGKVKISASASTNSIYIYSVQIYYTGAGTIYEQYRTACCNDPGFSFTDENDAPVTEYVIVREDLASASDAVEIDCNYTSSNTTGAITWYSTRRAALGFPATGAYTWTTPSSQPAGLNIDLANKKISASATGVWTITISQADGGTTYCPVDAVVTVRVKTVDKFVDAVNGNFGGDAQRREDTGDGITLPTEAEFSIDDGCSTERRLLGWVKESDLSSYTSGYIDSWKTGDPATNKVIAPGTKVQATGITWYAVWGEEK